MVLEVSHRFIHSLSKKFRFGEDIKSARMRKVTSKAYRDYYYERCKVSMNKHRVPQIKAYRCSDVSVSEMIPESICISRQGSRRIDGSNWMRVRKCGPVVAHVHIGVVNIPFANNSYSLIMTINLLQVE